METKGRILVVDDEETIREGVKAWLESEGYEAVCAESAEEAAEMAPETFDLILLDVMMDGMSGTDFARRLKSEAATSSVPVIFLTALGDEESMVDGLQLGADDYIPKPFSMKNLAARVGAVLRRSKPSVRDCPVQCDRTTLKCTVDGAPLVLPRKEFEILALLLENPGRIFSREELLDRLWPERTVVNDRTVDVHVARIRSKLGTYGRCVIARSGYGYGWQD